MALELTEEEAGRLESTFSLNKKYSSMSGRKVWTEARELEIVNLLKSNQSVCSIIREKHISGKKIEDIRRKYKLWGA